MPNRENKGIVTDSMTKMMANPATDAKSMACHEKFIMRSASWERRGDLRDGDHHERHQQACRDAQQRQQREADVAACDHVRSRHGQSQTELLPVGAFVKREDGDGQREGNHHAHHGSGNVEVSYHDGDEDAHDDGDAQLLQQVFLRDQKIGHDHGFHRISPFSIMPM